MLWTWTKIACGQCWCCTIKSSKSWNMQLTVVTGGYQLAKTIIGACILKCDNRFALLCYMNDTEDSGLGGWSLGYQSNCWDIGCDHAATTALLLNKII